jgi:hypothetical protein
LRRRDRSTVAPENGRQAVIGSHETNFNAFSTALDVLSS